MTDDRTPAAVARYDVFVSHASEDKDEVVEPLIGALEDRGLRVWYDRAEIALGDDFRRSIDDGLRRSRFGVVVLSPSFRKHWTEAELSALHGLEELLGETRILPVRHALTAKELGLAWPLLATRKHVSTDDGVDAVADQVREAVDRAAAADARRAPGRPSRLVNVPMGSVCFVGRTVELERVGAMLTEPGAVRLTAAVEGLAGIGKTELALQLAQKLAAAGAFPGGIYWFGAEQPDLTPDWGQTVADALGLPPGPLAERAALAIRTVERSARPVLLVLDNVVDWSDERRPHPLPGGAHVRLLVTTRQARLGGQRFKHVALGVLDDRAARELLHTLAGREGDGLGDVDPLLAHLDGHALAVELAGAYLGEYPEETAASYLDRLRAGETPADDVADLTRYERTARQAFQTHWDALDDDLRQAWRIAAQFEPGGASVELLELAGVDRDQRRALRRAHLIDSAVQGRWSMHRLVMDFGRRQGPNEAQANARESFVRGCTGRSKDIDIDAGFRIYLPDRAQLDAAMETAEAVLGEADVYVSILMDRVATARQSLGNLHEARILFERAMRLDIAHRGENDASVAAARSGLGLLLRDLGEFEDAHAHLEKALEWALATQDDDSPHVATCRSNLAIVLYDMKSYEDARSLLEDALASDLANYGQDHPTVALRRSNLAAVHRDLGQYERACELLEGALASDISNLGEDHPSVAIRRSNLAMVLRDGGDPEQARRQAKLALEITQKLPRGSYVRENVEAALDWAR